MLFKWQETSNSEQKVQNLGESKIQLPTFKEEAVGVTPLLSYKGNGAQI
jgi:hypothetical protein